MQHAIRLGTAVSFGLWLAYTAGFPEPTWPVITVLMVAQPTVGASVQKGMLRFAGTVVAAFVAIALYGAFAQTPLVLAAAISVVYAVGAYGKAGPRHGYAWNVFAFTTGIILGSAMSGTNEVENLAFDRAALVSIGLLASFAAESLFWPDRPEDKLRETLATRLREIGADLERVRALLSGAEPTAEAAVAPSQTRLIDQLGIVDQIRTQLGVTRSRTLGYLRSALLTHGLGASVRALATEGAPPRTLPAPLLDATTRLLDRFVAAQRDASAALADGRAPQPLADALQQGLARFESERIANLTQLLEGGLDGNEVPRPDTARDAALLSAQAPVLRRISELLIDLETSLTTIAGADDRAAREDHRDVARAKLAHRFRAGRPEVDPLLVELALRTGMAVMSVFVLMPLMGWSASPTTLTLVFIFASLPTRGALNMTVLGGAAAATLAWVLGDLSIVYLVPHIGRMPGALVYPFVLAGAAGYLAVRFPKLAPITPTIALIPIMEVFGGVRPPDNVMGPYLTTWVVFSGIAIGIAAQRLVFPRTAAATFLIRVAEQLALSLQILRFAPDGEESRRIEHLVARVISDYDQKSALVTQLHGQAHLEPAEQGLDDDRRAQLFRSAADLFDASLRAGPLSGLCIDAESPAARQAVAPLLSSVARQDEAVLSSLDAAISTLEEPGSPAPGIVGEANARVEAEIAALRERAGAVDELSVPEIDTLIARLDARRHLAACALGVEQWLAEWSKERRA